jgi:hypothetical protein
MLADDADQFIVKINIHPTMAKAPAKKEKASPPPSQISVTQFILASLLFQFFLSYIITETWTWGYKSKWMYPTNWKYLIVTFLCCSR